MAKVLRSAPLAWPSFHSLTVLTLLLTSACLAPLPPEHLRLYAETAAQTRSAGGLVLDRLAPIVAANIEAPKGSSDEEARDCGPDVTRIPRCFDPNLVAGGAGAADPPSVATHRLALDLVVAYATLLADLAEGKSVAEVRARVGQVADIASGILALTGVGVPVAAALPVLRPQLQALVGRLEAARSGQVVRQALVADRETVKAVLRALEGETPRIFGLYRAKRRIDLLAAARSRDQAAVDAVVDDVKRFRDALEAYVRLLRATASALDALAHTTDEATRPSVESLQAALRQAIDARAEAQALWNTVRQLDSARR